MTAKRSSWVLLAAGACLGVGSWLVLPTPPNPALAHKEPHTAEQLKTFEALFMEQVKIGDALFHGDAATQEKLKVKLSNTGWACAMCHPFASDTHPAQFPKWQEQMSKFATLRDMINWCIETKPERNSGCRAHSTLSLRVTDAQRRSLCSRSLPRKRKRRSAI
jgi:thiosulfate dehydrogenase